MPMDIDGFAVLGAIGRQPDAFPAVQAEAGKVARALVAKQLKDKGLTVTGLKAIAQAIDLEAFDLIVDAMSDAEVKALLGKVDKLNGEAKSAAAMVQRSRVADLARGTAAPVEKAVSSKEPSAPKVSKPKVERSGNSKAARARKKV